MDKKVRNATIVFMVFIIVMATMYVVAQHIVTSPKKTITVSEYTLTLDANVTDTCVLGDSIRFSGILTLNGDPEAGQLVKLYCNDTYTNLNDTTVQDGSYSIIYPTTTLGTFEFYTEVETT